MSLQRFLASLSGFIFTGIVFYTAVSSHPFSTPTTHANRPPSTHCPPLDLPTTPTITVNNQADLINQATNAAGGTTIWIAPGTNNMSSYIHIIHSGIALRGQTGSRDDVILDFGGMIDGHFGILADADDMTIAGLTWGMEARFSST